MGPFGSSRADLARVRQLSCPDSSEPSGRGVPIETRTVRTWANRVACWGPRARRRRGSRGATIRCSRPDPRARPAGPGQVRTGSAVGDLASTTPALAHAATARPAPRIRRHGRACCGPERPDRPPRWGSWIPPFGVRARDGRRRPSPGAPRLTGPRTGFGRVPTSYAPASRRFRGAETGSRPFSSTTERRPRGVVRGACQSRGPRGRQVAVEAELELEHEERPPRGRRPRGCPPGAAAGASVHQGRWVAVGATGSK